MKNTRHYLLALLSVISVGLGSVHATPTYFTNSVSETIEQYDLQNFSYNIGSLTDSSFGTFSLSMDAGQYTSDLGGTTGNYNGSVLFTPLSLGGSVGAGLFSGPNPQYNETFVLPGDNSAFSGDALYGFETTDALGKPLYGWVEFSTTSPFDAEFFSYTTLSSTITWGIDLTGATTTVGATSSAVPEPSTYALLGLGALALVIAYRRRRA